ncbi:MAG: hypothetical protein P8Y13_12470 [Deinococcales bacterium]
MERRERFGPQARGEDVHRLAVGLVLARRHLLPTREQARVLLGELLQLPVERLELLLLRGLGRLEGGDAVGFSRLLVERPQRLELGVRRLAA